MKQNKKLLIKQNYLDRRAFTLVELLVAMAIIAILIAVVLVGFQGYAKDARASKALTSITSVLPSLYSCAGNGGIINSPVSGTDGPLIGDVPICSLSTSYGYWPKSTGDLSDFEYRANSFTQAAEPPKDINNFHILFFSDENNASICCNSAMKNCKIISMSESFQCWGAEVVWFNCNQTCPAS